MRSLKNSYCWRFIVFVPLILGNEEFLLDTLHKIFPISLGEKGVK